jgi:signal peptidase II
MTWSPVKRMAAVAALVLLFDRLTKMAVVRHIVFGDQLILVPGFFKFVHWGNTGAAWSIFYGNNGLLAVVSLLALGALFLSHHHFDSHRASGQFALGLMFGGILGNLWDRLWIGHVVDFLYFYVQRRGGEEIGFPAFNLADTAICTGVGLIILFSWQNGPSRVEPDPDTPKPT